MQLSDDEPLMPRGGRRLRAPTYYEQLIEADLYYMHSLHRYMSQEKMSKVRHLLSRIISSNPLEDISLFNWVTFFVVMGLNAFTDRWFTFLFATSMNLAIAFIFRLIFQARRPFEIDHSLRPWTNKTRNNFGFPSLETHMAVVVNGFVAVRFAHWYVSIFLFLVSILIGFTRVYSNSRFIHQIVLSYVTGLAGLTATFRLAWRYQELKLHWQLQVIYGIFFGFAVVAMLGMLIEDNSTHFLSIPDSEYIRVVGGILNTDPSKIQEHMAAQSQKTLDRMGLDGATDKARQRAVTQVHRRKDSFFHLHNSIARKATEKKQLQTRIRAERAALAREAARRNQTEQEKWRGSIQSGGENDFVRAFVGGGFGVR